MTLMNNISTSLGKFAMSPQTYASASRQLAMEVMEKFHHANKVNNFTEEALLHGSAVGLSNARFMINQALKEAKAGRPEKLRLITTGLFKGRHR